MITIETDRLLMREFLPEDAEEMYLLNKDPKVMQYTGDIPFSNPEEALHLIENYNQYDKYQMGRLSVIRKTDNAFLGWCGLKFLEETKEIDLGYRFHRKYWGLGYATEACKANIEFGFRRADIHTIVGRTRKDNITSIRVLEKVGMRYVKEFMYDGMPSLYYMIRKS